MASHEPQSLQLALSRRDASSRRWFEAPTSPAALDNMIPCDGTMTCRCAWCQLERLRAIQRGVRPIRPVPIKIKREGR